MWAFAINVICTSVSKTCLSFFRILFSLALPFEIWADSFLFYCDALHLYDNWWIFKDRCWNVFSHHSRTVFLFISTQHSYNTNFPMLLLIQVSVFESTFFIIDSVLVIFIFSPNDKMLCVTKSINFLYLFIFFSPYEPFLCIKLYGCIFVSFAF